MSQNGCADFTVLSNCFIDTYMADANDAQLKIYLYLLRMVNAGQNTSISDLADLFNYTEKDIIRALKYWEKKKLLKLSFREDKSLESLQFLPIPDAAKEAGDGKNSPAIPTPIPSVRLFTTVTDLTKENEPEQSADPYEKPQYSLDQLKAFKSNEASSRLLFIAEQYIGRPLSPSEMKTILFFTDELHFNEDLIDYLLQYCVEKGKKDFKYIEKVAINWATEGVSTVKQAQKCSTKYDKNVYAIMNELGKNGSPTAKEMEFINRWTREYGFTTDIIFEACERTVLATDKHRFEYAESILSNWKEENVHHKADIHRIDALYQKKKNSPRTGNVNKFNQFSQNNYDFEALEKQLLSN